MLLFFYDSQSKHIQILEEIDGTEKSSEKEGMKIF